MKLLIHSQTSTVQPLNLVISSPLYWVCNYLSMLWLKLIHVRKRTLRSFVYFFLSICRDIGKLWYKIDFTLPGLYMKNFVKCECHLWNEICGMRLMATYWSQQTINSMTAHYCPQITSAIGSFFRRFVTIVKSSLRNCSRVATELN